MSNPLELTPEAQAIQALFYLQNKEGKKIPFFLNSAQRFLDKLESQFSAYKIIIAKARQKGFSSGILAKDTIRCLGHEGTHAVVMSHESSATQRLLDKVQFYLKHMKGPKPVYGRNSRNELYFPKMESSFYIGTAGAKAFGRGDFITDLHCSEYAWWDDAARHHAGAFQAVPKTGRIILESTGNGRNNDFYYVWKHADSMGYQRLFYPWFADDEYSLQCDTWKPDLPKYNAYMLASQARYKVAPQKMAWYEMKLKEMREDLKLMQQEYPFEPEECFQATGGAIFHVEESFSSLWQSGRILDTFCNRLQGHPKPNSHYVIGADPSGGTGNDDASINILCCETGEQVLEFYNPNTDPIAFARILGYLGDLFNGAFIVCEGNNHGIATLSLLKETYPKANIYKSKFATTTSKAKYGWLNSQQSKHGLIGIMLEDIGDITLYGKQTADELNAFEETPEGKFEGRSDNCVISLGLAIMGLKKYAYLRGRKYDAPKPKKEKPNYMSYSLDTVLANLNERVRNNLRKQTGAGYG